MRRIATEFLTRFLNDDRNQNQMDVCKDLQFKYKNGIRFFYNFKADYNMENIFKVTKIRVYSRG